MQYFRDRIQAGVELSKLLERYRKSESVVVALSSPGILVGKTIANNLRLPLGVLASQEVRLPWEGAPIVGSVNMAGKYTRNHSLGEGMLDEFEGEFHSHIDQEKMRASHEINLMHVSNVMQYDRLKDKTIIIVNDGLQDTRAIDEVVNYIKPIKVERLVAALPVATVDVIDKLHVTVDEIHCLDVKQNYVSTEHYYENNEIPEYDELLKILITFDTME